MNGFPKRWKLGALMTALAVCSLVGLSIEGAQADPPSRKQMRETRIFERVMDDMLIDSRNFLVPGRENTRAYHVPGHGLIVTFEATLVDRNYNRGIRFWSWGGDDRHRGRRSDHDWDDDWDDDDDDDDRSKRRSSRDRSSDREERLYERGKQEIQDVLMDYGDSFEGMGSGEVVEVVVFLGDADHFYDRDIERLVMRVKVDDLRAYGNDSLDEKGLQSRIVVEEY